MIQFAVIYTVLTSTILIEVGPACCLAGKYLEGGRDGQGVMSVVKTPHASCWTLKDVNQYHLSVKNILSFTVDIPQA